MALVTADAGLRWRWRTMSGISTFRTVSAGGRSRWLRLRTDGGHGCAALDARPRPRRRRAAGLFARRSPSGFRPRSFLRAFVRRPEPLVGAVGPDDCPVGAARRHALCAILHLALRDDHVDPCVRTDRGDGAAQGRSGCPPRYAEGGLCRPRHSASRFRAKRKTADHRPHATSLRAKPRGR